MRLSIKLFIMMVIMLSALVGLGFFSSIQLKKVNQKSTEISSNWLPSTIAVQHISTLTASYRMYEVSYIFTKDKDALRQVEQFLHNVSHELSIARKHYEGYISSQKEKDIYKKFSKLWKNYIEKSHEIFVLAQNNDTDAAIDLLRGDSRNLFEQATVQLYKAVNFNRDEGIKASIAGDEEYHNSLNLIHLSIVAVFILASAIFLWIIYSLRIQLGKDPAELIQITTRVVDGDYAIDDKKTHYGVYKHLVMMVASLKLHIDSAEKNARVKSEFLANMSHEIRTPMNGILGLLHLLSHTKLTAKQADYVQKSLFSANNLLRIIDDILDFSKMEAGKLELEHTPFHIFSLLQEAASLYSSRAKEKGLFFHIDTNDCQDYTLMGDSLRIKQVIFNLVSNAIKFTELGGITVTVQCQPVVDNTLPCVFSVQDSGVGLSKEQQQRLFSAFSQADSSVTRKYGGTGLGLVISKQIVEAMKGRIWIQSEQGQGTTFFFALTFPLCAEQNIAIQAESIPQQDEHNASMHREHILVVEDNEINQIIAKELLQEVGFVVDIAENGKEAIDMINENKYSAVLMDIQMPVMDGLTAARNIRKNPTLKNLVIIAMSAHAMSGDKEISLEHGMNDHITKPIDPQRLYTTLDYWLKRASQAIQ